MLRPVKRSGGRRYYRSEDVKLVATIDRLVHREGYTLRGARLAIEGKKAVSEAPVIAKASAPSPTILPELRALRAKLADALAAG
jgi:DNA-binding transcriptional MerR regulator